MLLPPLFAALTRPTRRIARLGFALAALWTLAGCATLDLEPKGAVSAPITGSPVEAPRTLGLETPVSAEQKRLTAMFGGRYVFPAAEDYLNSVLAKLAAAGDKPSQAYRVTILNSPVVNAFALPSGDLFVTRGLLALANDTSEVAAVMAHEIGHVTAGHAQARAETEKQHQLIRKASEAFQGKERGAQIQNVNLVSFANFSRQQEFEADQIGVRTIAAAGYDPYGAERFLSSLGRSIALRASMFNQKQADKPDLMSTHPSTPERIQRAVAAARQIGAPGIGAAARNEYLAAINGMDFGDDPTDGVIRGRRFQHPRFGFGFEAPEGFVLENTPQAVLGVADGGSRALRLDSVHVGGDTALDAYLASGWIEGLQLSSIQSTTINGLPAATATARSGEWSFRVAVFRLGTDVYRMIYATRELTEPTDARFRESIGTFRRISSDEASRLRSLRLSIVVSEGEAARAMAARMAIPDRPLEQFLLLNGLERDGPLKAGERYKIVIE